MRTDLERISRQFQALSDGRRLRILNLLTEGERCVCDLTKALGAAQSLLSFHLKTLKAAGLVVDRRDGRWVYYSLNTETAKELNTFVRTLTEPATSSRRCE